MSCSARPNYQRDDAAGRWFSPGPPVSSTNKNDRNDITEILLKVALNTIKPKQFLDTQLLISKTSNTWSHVVFRSSELSERQNTFPLVYKTHTSSIFPISNNDTSHPVYSTKHLCCNYLMTRWECLRLRVGQFCIQFYILWPFHSSPLFSLC
jgi:hypothetical protein